MRLCAVLFAAIAGVVACATTAAPPALKASAARSGDAPVTAAEWKELCEAQAERARKCPGPAPQPIAKCTERAACFGALVRSEVIHALVRCQSQSDCSRPCTIDRVTAALPPTPTNTALADACVTRRALCPALDCNAVVRPVRPLETGSITPLIECMQFESSCLDVAACVLEKMAPVLAQVNSCGPSSDRDGGASPPP